MQKTLVIASREFRQRIRKRGFLIASIGVPVMMLILWAVTGVMDGSPPDRAEPESAERPDRPIGYVDRADLVQAIPASIPADMFRSFPDAQAAEAALAQGDIGAYYVILPHYRQSGEVRRVSQQLTATPPDSDWFERLLSANLLPEADPDFLARLRRPFAGLETVIVSGQGQAESQGSNMLPFLVTMVIIVPLFTSGSYLFQGLTQEKSSRVMEILLVSVRPRQLLTGKLLGLSALTLVQYAIWIALGLLASLVTGREMSRLLADINLSMSEGLLVVAFALGGFLLYAALMAGVGALARDVEDSRTWLFVISLPMMLPIYLWVAIARTPHGFLAVVLSLFPFSAPVAMLMRLTSAAVPAWQVGISLGLLALTGLGTIRLMARLFRAQTLLSGEPLSVRRFLAALRA